MKKDVTQEKMRYLVPGEVNNFWSAHKRFILLCAVSTAIVFILALSVAVIINIHKLEPKVSFVFLCEVEDYDAALAATERFSDRFEIYFVRYDYRFGSGEDGVYDLSALGKSSEFTPGNIILYVLNKDLSDRLEKHYFDYDLEIGAKLSAEQIAEIMEQIAL